jgi:hypothetical protein
MVGRYLSWSRTAKGAWVMVIGLGRPKEAVQGTGLINSA